VVGQHQSGDVCQASHIEILSARVECHQRKLWGSDRRTRWVCVQKTKGDLVTLRQQ
jgi:hypothetical protein